MNTEKYSFLCICRVSEFHRMSSVDLWVAHCCVVSNVDFTYCNGLYDKLQNCTRFSIFENKKRTTTFIIRSTLRQSWPNKAGVKCPPSTKSLFDFNEIWHDVGRGRWLMHDGMQYDPIQGQGYAPFKVGNPAIFKSCLLRHLQLSWQLTMDSGFYMFPSFYVMWLWNWHKHQLWRVDCQSHTG